MLPGLQVGEAPRPLEVRDPVVSADASGRVVAAGLGQGGGVARLIVVRYRADGGLDPSFGRNGVSVLPARQGSVQAVASCPDGRVLVAGAGGGGFSVTRLRPDGSLDATFGDDGTAATVIGKAGSVALTVEPLPDGGVVAAGGAPASNGNAALAIARYRADGGLDPGFGRGGVVVSPLPEQPYDISAEVLTAGFDAEGRVVFGGQVPLAGGNGPFVARLLAGGSPDPAFGRGGIAIGRPGPSVVESAAMLPGGAVLAGGEARSGPSGTLMLTRYRPDGSPDPGYGTGGTVAIGGFGVGYRPLRLALHPDGSIGVVVDLGSPAGTPVAALVRLRADGSRDPAFGDNGVVHAPFGNPSGIAALPDGGDVVAGGGPGFQLARYRADGSQDPAFVTDPPTVTPAGAAGLALEPNGSAVVAGWTDRDGRRVVEVARLGQDGYDPAFGDHGIVAMAVGAGDSEATAVVRLPDGRLLVAGRADGSGLLLRFTSNGHLDPSFGNGGVVIGPQGAARALALLPDGGILVAGRGFAVSRYLPDGRLDPSFGAAGTSAPPTGDATADALVLQPDGRILVAGERSGAFVLVRLRADGAIDPTFGDRGVAGGPLGTATSLALQPDGRIVAAASGFAVARYDTHGRPDPAFGVDGVATPPVAQGDAAAVAVQHDGTIVVAGWSSKSPGGAHRYTLARLDALGYVDETFGSGYGQRGVVTTDVPREPAEVAALALAGETDRIVAAGTGTELGVPGVAVAWYVENGDLAPRDGSPLRALAGSRVRALTRIGVSSPALSPNGRLIAFLSSASGRPELYVVATSGGKTRRLTSSPFGADSVAPGRLSWSPDGRTIAFGTTGHVPDPRCTHACLTRDVYAVAPDGRRLRRLVSDGLDASWSHDGRYLAYTSTAGSNGGERVVVAAADGARPRAVATGADPRWSPRTDTLVLETATGLAVRRAGGALVRALTGYMDPSWSPDGRRLAALTTPYGAELDILGLDGGVSRRVTLGYALRAPSWSPDGTRLAYFNTHHNRWALVVRSTETSRLLQRIYGYRSSVPAQWSPNGRTIYVGG